GRDDVDLGRLLLGVGLIRAFFRLGSVSFLQEHLTVGGEGDARARGGVVRLTAADGLRWYPLPDEGRGVLFRFVFRWGAGDQGHADDDRVHEQSLRVSPS